MVDLIKVVKLEGWFLDALQGLRCSPEALAYVAGVLKAQGSPQKGDDMSRSSIVLTYQDAVVRGDFASFQRIGDWVLWSGIVVPDRCEQERDVALLFGRLSYLSCHRILRGQWRVYEELANELPSLAAEAHRRLVKGPPVPR